MPACSLRLLASSLNFLAIAAALFFFSIVTFCFPSRLTLSLISFLCAADNSLPMFLVIVFPVFGSLPTPMMTVFLSVPLLSFMVAPVPLLNPELPPFALQDFQLIRISSLVV